VDSSLQIGLITLLKEILIVDGGIRRGEFPFAKLEIFFLLAKNQQRYGEMDDTIFRER
jgi:hypothetical protein